MRGGDIMRELRILLGVNFKLVIMKPLLLCIGYLLFVPIVHGTSNLEAKYVAEVLEKFVSVIGIILIVPLCSPELNIKNIKEVIWGKVFSYGKTIAIRMFMSIVILCFLTFFFAIILRMLHCEFPFVTYIVGTVVTAGTIGMVGFNATLITNNLILGYIFSVSYFFMCWTGIISEENPVYLFSMINNQLQQKGVLLLIILFCVAGSSGWLHQKNTDHKF